MINAKKIRIVSREEAELKKGRIQRIKTSLAVMHYNIAEEFKDKANEAFQLHKQRDYSAVSIVFSALTLETLINEIGFKDLKDFDSIERLPPEIKWFIVPYLLSGRTFDWYKEPFLSIKELFALRNKIVHYKSKYEKPAEIKVPKYIKKMIKPQIIEKPVMSKIELQLTKKNTIRYFCLIREIMEKFLKLTKLEPPTWVSINILKEE